MTACAPPLRSSLRDCIRVGDAGGNIASHHTVVVCRPVKPPAPHGSGELFYNCMTRRRIRPHEGIHRAATTHGTRARARTSQAKSVHADRLWPSAASLMRLAISHQQVPSTAAGTATPHSVGVSPVVLSRA